MPCFKVGHAPPGYVQSGNAKYPTMEDCDAACDCPCSDIDQKPCSDPSDEGTWVPSGTWLQGVTWTFVESVGNKTGNTWFFYGSAATSKIGGGATFAQQLDWYNVCNWYSHKATAPSMSSDVPASLDKRARRLPPDDAVVMIYTPVSTITKPIAVTVKSAYFFGGASLGSVLSNFYGSLLTTTHPAHNSNYGTVFLDSSNNGNASTINGGASFYQSGAGIHGNRVASIVNGGAEFYNKAVNFNTAIVNDGAVFWGNGENGIGGTVNGGAEFYSAATNVGLINGGAVFNDSSRNLFYGTVNGGAVFNDDSCSVRSVGNFFANPCTRKFVAHPTDLPTCNGTAKSGCFTPFEPCGCG